MIGLSRALRVYAYAAPVDMRKAYEGLSAIVRNELRRDVLDGELFLFVGKTRRRAKVLLFDGTGLCIYMKQWMWSISCHDAAFFASTRAADIK